MHRMMALSPLFVSVTWDKAFLLWIEWACCYKMGTESYDLLNDIYCLHYLASMIHHDFTDEGALWRMWLQ